MTPPWTSPVEPPADVVGVSRRVAAPVRYAGEGKEWGHGRAAGGQCFSLSGWRAMTTRWTWFVPS